MLESNADLGTIESREIVLPIDFRSQEQSYQRKIQQLTKANDFLKVYTEKALFVLKDLLTKHGEIEKVKNLSNIVEEAQVPENIPPWFTSEEYMQPLLTAYDIRLKEMVRNYFG